MLRPKMDFKDEKEMYSCLEEWKKRLGLSDWQIGIALCTPDEMNLKECAGESEVQWVHKCGTIGILRREYIPDNLLLKQPQEETLIHELLHFKFFSLEERSREESFYEMKQHQLLQEIAMALYMAKYGIDKKWFVEEDCKV